MSAQHLAIFLVAVCVSTCLAGKPDFCRSYDCPEFTTKETVTDKFELRAYEASTWVSISKKGSSLDSITDGMFMDLYRYIDGGNTNETKIKMTVPVVKRVDKDTDGTYEATMMFYLTTENPPAPKNQDLEIINLPAMNVYVRKFYTWFKMADNDRFLEEAGSLKSDLNTTSIYPYYQAGYASPFWPIKKHQEVWMDRP